MAPVCEHHCRAGLVARYTRRLTLRNVAVFDQVGDPIQVTDSEDVRRA
jgi:hypothetical protein